jgi:hypothetical protein
MRPRHMASSGLPLIVLALPDRRRVRCVAALLVPDALTFRRLDRSLGVLESPKKLVNVAVFWLPLFVRIIGVVWAQVSTLPLLSKDLDPRFSRGSDIASAASWTALRREIATYRSKASTLQAGESAGADGSCIGGCRRLPHIRCHQAARISTAYIRPIIGEGPPERK